MATSVLQAAQIYEDPDVLSSSPRKNHTRAPSVGDVLRGRRRDNSPTKPSRSPQNDCTSPSPLGERHINSLSPPQSTTKVPTKQEDGNRPPMHKKTSSSVSLRDLIMGRQAEDNGIRADRSATSSPKKQKSSTNLAGLLKKKSRKDLKEPARNQENVSPSKLAAPEPTPIWRQFATQPQEKSDGSIQYPQAVGRSLEEEISLYTPRDYSEFRPHEQRNFYGYGPSPVDYKPPQRPFLEHKSSRSSIFSEHLDEDVPELKRPKSRDQSSSRPSSSRVTPAVPEKESSLQKASPEKSKRSSRVLDVIATFNMRSKESAPSTPVTQQPLSPQELDDQFEKVLDARNIPHNMRNTMRNLKPELKAALMRGERSGSGDSSSTSTPAEARTSRSPTKKDERPKSEDGDGKDGKRPRSRSRTRSRILTLSKRDVAESPAEKEKKGSSLRSRSKTRPKSVDMSSSRPGSARSLGSSGSAASLAAAPDSATTPGDFIHYLREVQKPSLVEVGKLHKLRILLRNESVTWTDTFVTKGGMNELVQLFYRISKVEWREEHEDNLLHETLLCLKALCTTELAMERFAQIEDEFFPCLLSMLFDPERKGPSEYNTRGVVVSLLFAHLCAAQSRPGHELEARARKILGLLQDPAPEQGKQTLEFVSQMHMSRPYRVWSKEVTNVTKEVFWIFLHHLNVVPILENSNPELSYMQKHFPAPRPPHPAAPYVGGVEWEATQYLAIHLDLLNGILASLHDADSRNSLRNDLKQSGWEKAMGSSLRTCKEKFYGGVHDGLKIWVAAAKADGWEVEDVRAGPPRESSSPKKSPSKNAEPAPKIGFDVMPKRDEGWL
ncbi:uncharacterized protein HMPREF1541_02402 [Cyphellophora europaea CBS 101466]|uniref:Formin GTPase-binding domain-containing protein n=1 Tax=Cyphellophora europaea (strain CBS 101466) TaxID=1220924 RepID=W2S5B4_CYPE1|nr:uncharacterized protein HMPREF1541_02402 [Cyphellophora europaea CBS 101466]ETN43243.1 hypothetical protein HMPREF1541_02402 [Cyphellophora europaea CBS 101466]